VLTDTGGSPFSLHHDRSLDEGSRVDVVRAEAWPLIRRQQFAIRATLVSLTLG